MLQLLEDVRTGKTRRCGVCREPRSLVHVFGGQWSLPLSTVTCGRRCIDTLIQVGPVPAFFFLAVCNASQGPFEGKTSFRQQGLDAAILLHQHVPACFVSFFHRHCSRAQGVMPKTFVSRGRSSVRILLASRKIQSARSQKFREVCSSQSMTT